MSDPRAICMQCGSSLARHLEGASRHATVDYFRCEQCGHVWAVDKVRGIVRHVTDQARKKD
jgi:hypothetical protein